MHLRPSVCVDFDGVINRYTNYKGKGIFEDPVSGCREGLEILRRAGWVIIIHTTRIELDRVEIYLNQHNIPYDHINFNPVNIRYRLNLQKPAATVYLDDKGICFEGDWPKAVEQIINFKPWYRR